MKIRYTHFTKGTMFSHPVENSKQKIWRASLSIVGLFLFLIGCGIEFGNPSDDDGSRKISVLTGVVAEGKAIGDASLYLWDRNGLKTQVGSTQESGKYQFEVSKDAAFPALLCAIPDNRQPMCTLLEKRPSSSHAVTRHINPLTFQASLLWSSMDLTKIQELKNETIAAQLQLKHTSSFDSLGQSVVNTVFGEEISFDLFNKDPQFQAYYDNSPNQPSISDLILDSIALVASNENLKTDEFLQNQQIRTEVKASPLLSNHRFQVAFSASYLLANRESSQVKATLNGVVVSEPFTSNIQQITTSIEPLHQDALAWEFTRSEQQLMFQFVLETLVWVINEEQNIGTEMTSEALGYLVQNVVQTVDHELIRLITAQRGTNTEPTVLETAFNNAAQQTGYLIAHLSTAQIMNNSALGALQQEVEPVIASVFELFVKNTTVQSDESAFLEEIQVSQREIQPIVETAVEHIEQKPPLTAFIKPQGDRPPEPPKGIAALTSGILIHLEDLDKVTVASSSQVLAFNEGDGKIQMRIDFTHQEVNESLLLEGVFSQNNAAQGEMFLAKKTSTTQETHELLGHWNAVVENNRLTKFKLTDRFGGTFHPFQLKIEVPVEQNGWITGAVIFLDNRPDPLKPRPPVVLVLGKGKN
ncbi:hypothetical protein WDW89_14890 [Deltaproteobacteria bacterium TL4]